MPKPNLYYFDDNVTPLFSFNFAVFLAGYEDLGPLVTSFQIPSRSMGHVRVEFMGKSKTWPARRISSSNEVTMRFLLNRQNNTYQQLLGIQESFSESATGNVIGTPFAIKAVLYDDIGNEAMIVTFNESWLREIGEISLDATAESEVISIDCVFMYAKASYAFTGLSSSGAASFTSILTNMGIPLRIGDSDPFGIFAGLGISRQLPGTEPQAIVSQIRDQLASLLNINIPQLNNVRNVMSTLRSTADGITSKANALNKMANTLKSNALGKVVSSFKSLL